MSAHASSRSVAPGVKSGRSRINANARVVFRPRIMLWHAGWGVLAASLALMVVGVYSIALASSDAGSGMSGLAWRQAAFAAVGLAAGAAAVFPHYRRLAVLTWPLAIVTVALLVFVLIPVVPDFIVQPRNGARRWISLGVAAFQPSELAKVAFVVMTAWYLRYRKNYRRFLGLVPPALIAFVPMVLILIEPDLGSALLFIPALLAMLIAAGAKLWHLITTSLLVAVLGLAVTAASLVMAEQQRYPLLRRHQVERVQALLDQYKGDERFLDDRGFQGKQAMTLIGAGGIAGHPENHSRALIKFSALPERHNDMIFAVIANRFGLIGAWGVMGLYLAWSLCALWVAGSSKDAFGRIIVVGFTAMVIIQALINIGETLGLLPITGMTLPFVSYGGSSLLIGAVMVGIILNVAMRRPDYLWRKSFEFDGDES